MVFGIPVTLAAPSEIDLNSKEGIQYYIEQEATLAGVDPYIVKKVIECESQYRGDVYGDQGMAYGLAQFWPETFVRLGKKAGIDPMYERGDYRSQIKILIWSIENGHGREWTCYRKYSKS